MLTKKKLSGDSYNKNTEKTESAPFNYKAMDTVPLVARVSLQFIGAFGVS